MTITLVRHGEVEEAYHRCYNGHNDIALSPKGIAEAARLGAYFQNHDFDALYCSDLKRCRQTLSPIIQNLKLTKGNTLGCNIQNVHYTPQLREKSWGRHEGMTFDAITKQEGLKYLDFIQWINALDGEPYDAYIGRIETFFTRELPLTPHNNVLVVTHAGVIRVLMHLLQKIPLEEAFSVDFPYGAYTTLNTSTSEFGAIRCV
ncbi:MAG: alpha-ribazole phosphatase family protein [Helicobacteraceae bacterium]|jgi:alpha-ribazole phosphatase|nr:alpha-ribazole phosphatase family protein [Helicobacteraceae bacterium]